MYAFDERWVEIGRYASRGGAEDDALALIAIGIRCRLAPQESGFGLFVDTADALRARRELVEYGRENRRATPQPVRSPAEGVTAALAYCAALVFLFAASNRQLFGLDWWSAGAARAGPIVGGEYWRTITALGLHADLGHLAGNVFAGSVFGILLAQFLGPGLAWFAILLAAAVGNAANALLQPAEHNAVGASTAVFAALGLLSALMWRRQASRWARGLRRWVPLAAGVTLLAYLGIGGERTDVGAHVAGFVAGVVFGAGLHVIGPRLPQGPAAQYTYGAAALALFCCAWLWAFRSV
jgi:membrane associated rhomboid family serine protease